MRRCKGRCGPASRHRSRHLHTRAGDLLERESDPGQTVELLADWERAYGLPDRCSPLNATIQQRRAALVARIASQGGQSVAYFVAFAATLGYAITITQFAPSRFGQPFGLPMNGVPWAHAWQVNAPSFTVEMFAFGRDAFGEPFAWWSNTLLQCELTRLAPAQTTLLFSYT